MILCLELKEVLLNIVVPLLAAFIGGLMALLGVKITLKQEANKRHEEIKIKNKPFLFRSNKPTEVVLYSKINISNFKKVNFRLMSDDSIKEIDLSNYFILSKVLSECTEGIFKQN